MYCKSTRTSLLLLGVLASLFLNGCGQEVAVRATIDEFPIAEAATTMVPGNSFWVDSGTDIAAGEAITISAWGRVQPGKQSTLAVDGSVGPEGTFFYSDDVLTKTFPLAATAAGPAPCYCLIGRIGQGEPFYIGKQLSWVAQESGRLTLGINDFSPEDNSGQFEARVEFVSTPKPVRYQDQRDPTYASPAAPIPNSRVVVFYLDGLRPDVINEMTAMGHLPTINRLFVEGGVWLGDTFTGFPSDTITSNGTMWTGCFSDRHGLKGQVRFSRRTLQSESYLEPLGPNRSSRLLAPQGVDKLIQNAQTETYNLTAGDGAGDRWKKSQTSGVPPLYQHLRNDGNDWATGILPMMTDVPPMLWTRSLVRNMPYLKAHDTWQYIDDANTHYAIKHLVPQNQPVTIIWLPETDSISHKQSRGQFGITRRTIALADRMIESVVKSLEVQGLLESTYFMLISDHGHHGGRDSHLTHFDIANELFHRPREMDEAGNWLGGGMGLSVRQHRFWNRHPEDQSREFVFVDGDSDGAARIFLPKGHFRSNEWMGTSSGAELLAYRLNDKLPRVNLPETIANARAKDGRGQWNSPIDLVLMRLQEDAVLITTRDRGQAIIDRKMTLDQKNKWEYRYRVVKNVTATSEGKVTYDVIENPVIDPLELAETLPIDFASRYFNEIEWLNLTAYSTYPDSVVVLTRHMLWQANLKYREEEFSPDLVVTAKPNWYFGLKSSPGTMHGYPLGDSMRATWFVSGPNIRKGARLQSPSRLADLTPTILHLVDSQTVEDDFDGRVVTEIFQPDNAYDSQADIKPVLWNDLDLNAWQTISYEPAAPYEHLPWTSNRPESGTDLNSIAYNVIAIGDINVWRIFDDVLSPLTGGENYFISTVENIEHKMWNYDDAVGEAAGVLDLSGMTIADYSQTSIGNVKRVDRAVDWVQKRTLNLDKRVAQPFGAEQTPPAKVVHGAIDMTQAAIWEAYRFGQRVLVQVLDETLLNGLENAADKGVHRYNQVPAEIVVPRR